MIGIVLMPLDAVDHETDRTSCIGEWIRKLRDISGRRRPDDDGNLLEGSYLALYNKESTELRLFDAASPISTASTLRRSLGYIEFIEKICEQTVRRNRSEIPWAASDLLVR